MTSVSCNTPTGAFFSRNVTGTGHISKSNITSYRVNFNPDVLCCRICVVCLAPTHPLLSISSQEVVNVDFKIEMNNKALGKRKKISIHYFN